MLVSLFQSAVKHSTILVIKVLLLFKKTIESIFISHYWVFSAPYKQILRVKKIYKPIYTVLSILILK